MKKKYFMVLFITAIFGFANAQPADLVFDKPYYRCENKWVALPSKDNGQSYSYCYVYLDRSAGFTMQLGGHFKIGSDGKASAVPLDINGGSVKYRIDTNYPALAILNDSRLKEIGLSQYPDWLANYREGEDKIAGLFRRGFIFNDLGASDIALPVLIEAYKKEPHYEGLEFELAFAYNALEQPENAIPVLEKALKNKPGNDLFYRELGYAYLHTNKIAEAEKTYTKGIALSDNKIQQAEMAFNMAYTYHDKKDDRNFKKWAALVEKYAAEDSVYLQHIKEMQTQTKQ